MSEAPGTAWPEIHVAGVAGGGPTPLPPALREEAERACAACIDTAGRADAGAAGESDGVAGEGWARLCRVFACSPFVATACAREPALLEGLLARATLPAEIAAPPAPSPAGEAEFARILRRYRRRAMVDLVYRSVTDPHGIRSVLADTSSLAERCVRWAVAFAEQVLRARHGVPRDGAGREQRLVTLAMGKLGAHELNFSSDVDLVFLFPAAGETDGRRSLSNDEFFTRVAQRAIRYLDDHTADGFVFRVDTRLRPFGASGRLVVPLAALEAYLVEHARAWERYAYARARPVTGTPHDRTAVLTLLTPFVYRRYLDYGVLESVREIRSLIASQVRRRDRSDDLKLGPGGIREIEFIVQTFQVLHGGRDRALRLTSTLGALEVLSRRGLLETTAARGLRDAYLLLRRAENAVQMARDEQVHALPSAPLEQARLACHLGFPDWAALREHLDAVRHAVSREFAVAVVNEGERRTRDGLTGVGRGEVEGAEAKAQLEAAGLEDAGEMAKLLRDTRESSWYARLTQVARERLDGLLPLVLSMVARESADADTLRRVLAVLEAVGSRSAYFAVLAENGQALEHLVRLCRLGPVVADYLVRSPALIDELIDPALFRDAPDRAELREDLDQRLSGYEADDVEGRLDALRLFQRTAVFRIAVGDLLGRLEVSVVSDLLTAVAESLLQATLTMARAQLAPRHGVPRHAGDGREMQFAVVAYGKLGGAELGYGSDLDLVFLHEGGAGASDGAQPLEPPVYFVRLAQRVIHLLSAPTSLGTLYQVDTRLRPSGNSGLLVTSLEAFAEYQRRDAWTWEHQALLRARAVAGDAQACTRFEAVRLEVLGQPRDVARLRRDVAQMRQRMRRELTVAAPGCFDIKQDSGGLVDLEFLVQFLVLANAAALPALLQVRDSAGQLRLLQGAGVLPARRGRSLIAAYYALRRLAHHASLRGERAISGEEEARHAAKVVADAFDELVAAPADGTT